jgi:PAS domain S-box-containing protein
MPLLKKSDRFLHFATLLTTEIGSLRLISLLTVPVVLGCWLLVKPGMIDSLEARIAVTAFHLVLFALSFVVGHIQRQPARYIHLSTAIIALWAWGLAVVNDFLPIYLVSYIAILLFAVINYREARDLIFLSVINVGLAIFGIFVTDELALGFTSLTLCLSILLVGFASLGLRNRMRRELDRSTELLNSLLENSPDAILIVQLESLQLTAHNKNAERVFGIDDDPEKLAAHFRPISENLQRDLGGQQMAIRRELLLPRVDGSDFWAEVLVSPIFSGARSISLITIMDISTRIATEQSMQLSDHILQEVDHLVVVADASANVIYCSPSVERTMGYSNASMLGQGWWGLPLGSPEDQASERVAIQETIAGLRSVRVMPYERNYFAIDGKLRSILWKDSLTQDGLLIAVGIENTEERHQALVRSVIFNIAEASSKAKTPGEFYGFIHREIRRVINTPNFYIAVYDQEADIVHFPYFSDAQEPKPPFSRRAGKGLTELTIRRRKPLLAFRQDILDLIESGLVDESVLPIAEVWLGVPLMHESECVGLVTLQDYERNEAFTSDDLALLSFIAGQVAQFVSKLQSDEALRISEERFRAIYDQAAVGIAQISADRRFQRANSRMAEIFGYTEEELSLLRPADITLPDDLLIGMGDLEAMLAGNLGAYTVEKRYLHKNGHVIHARVNVSAYREDNVLRFIISVYEDITDRILAQNDTAMLYGLSTTLDAATTVEEALEETVARLREQDNWEYSESWLISNENTERRTSQYLHRSLPRELAVPADILPNWRKRSSMVWWVHPQPMLDCPLAQQMNDLGWQTVVVIPILSEGSHLALLVLGSRRPRNASERLDRLIAAATSQLRTYLLRKMAEEAQKESEARYRAITEAAFEGIIIHRAGRILKVNNAFANLFGMDEAELEGRSLLDLLPNQSARDAIQRVVDGKGTSSWSGRRIDGSPLHIEAVGRPGTWEGSPAGIVAFRDITNDRLMEEAREAARLDARFRAYVQNSTEIIQILEPSGLIQYASPTLERYTGIEPESIVGTDFFTLMHPSEVAQVKAAFQRVLSQPAQSERVPLRILTEDGEWRNFQVAFTNLIDDDTVKGVLVSAHDVTDLKRTEAALLENEAKFRAIFSQANDAILVLDRHAIIECNDMALEMYGFSREELLGMELYSLSPDAQPDGSPSRAKFVGKTSDALDGINQYFTWKHRSSNGEFFDAEINMSQIRIGERIFVQCVVRDITERLQAESALRASEHRNKAILDAIPDIMLRISDSGKVLDYKAADQQALIAQDVIGAQIAAILPVAIADKVMERATLALKSEEGQQFEAELEVGEELRDYETRIVRSGQREALVMIRDVTERKRTEKELIKRNFELDSFVYRASHDLKAPLNSLMGLINIMGTENEDPSVQNYLRMMNKSVVKLDTFIRDLADFSRNARMELERGRIDWHSLINETLDNLKFMENADRVEKLVTVNCQGDFFSDPVRLGIVLNNLVSNAIKYQNLKRQDAWVKIEVDSRDQHAIIRISDNGIGISEEHQSKVFNLFFRASIQSYGSGMGMYIVKNAVERLRGTIHLESVYGVGSLFTVSLQGE